MCGIDREEVYLSHYTASHEGNRTANTHRTQSYGYIVFHVTLDLIHRYFLFVIKITQKYSETQHKGSAQFCSISSSFSEFVHILKGLLMLHVLRSGQDFM